MNFINIIHILSIILSVISVWASLIILYLIKKNIIKKTIYIWIAIIIFVFSFIIYAITRNFILPFWAK